nr:sensor histidine kinase [uncultured Prevotella sp.]
MNKGQKKSELILYVALWAVLFAAPVISMLVGDFFTSSPEEAQAISTTASSATTSSIAFSNSWDWQGVWNAWSLLSMFCATFFIHNFLIAPLLVYGNRKWAYGSLVVLLFACFFGYQVHFRPHHAGPVNEEGKPRIEQGIPQNQQHPYVQKQPPHELTPDKRPPHDEISLVKRENTEIPVPPLRPEDGKGERMGPNKRFEPPRAFGGQDSVAIIIMSLLLGLNVGIKYFFKSLDDKKRIKELERENLNRQLEYLKYQINPHFFMNTLNNIHALVDIDPEQAKYTIEVLSKLMRYVLYEGNKTMAPLQKELDFIRHYVDLMKIRYTDKVRISVSLPTSPSNPASPSPGNKEEGTSSALNLMDIQVPSLLFTTFVENAFKHGVSYQQDSFIEISVRVDEAAHEIYFLCNNSRKPEAEEKRKGGVGLENAKKRLALIYGDEYELKIDVTQEEYRLLLRLPIK